MRRLVLAISLVGCGFQAPLSASGADAGASSADAARDGGTTNPAIDAAIDAPPPDAALTCPASYTVTIAGSTTRYRISSANELFSVHHADCNDDLPGATHLAVFDSTVELDEISALLTGVPQPNSSRFYVGVVQQPDQANPDDGWLQFTGGPVPAALWSAGQPEDDGGFESNHEQQLAAVDAGLRMNDVSGTFTYGAICECDGQALDPTAAAAIP